MKLPKSQIGFTPIFTLLVLVAFLGVGLYVFRGKLMNSKRVPLSNEAATPSSVSNNSQWSISKDMVAYSFEYPAGWDIGYLLPAKTIGTEQIGSVALDPKKITGGAGGPGGAITMIDMTKLPDPESTLKKRKIEVCGQLDNPAIEEIQSDLGVTYHCIGKLTKYGNRTQENYILMIPSRDYSDKQNYHLVEIRVNDNDISSEILRQIALSFKRI